jgi:hypothetical protein
MKKFINKITTIAKLKENATEASLKEYRDYMEALRVLERRTPSLITNGRVNHYWIQGVISILSNGEMVPGGQGNSEPDMYKGEERVEIKGFTTTEFETRSPIRVAASKFFASNGGITALKNSDKTLETMKEIVFSSSYSDDYYMLTETCGLKSLDDFEKVRIIFVDSNLLKSSLIEDCGPHCDSQHFSWETPSGKSKTKKINWPYTHVDTSKLVESIGELNGK